MSRQRRDNLQRCSNAAAAAIDEHVDYRCPRLGMTLRCDELGELPIDVTTQFDIELSTAVIRSVHAPQTLLYGPLNGDSVALSISGSAAAAAMDGPHLRLWRPLPPPRA